MSKQRMRIPDEYAGVEAEHQVESDHSPPLHLQMRSTSNPAPPHKATDYDSFIALVQQMWKQDPDERPAFDVILHELSKMFI